MKMKIYEVTTVTINAKGEPEDEHMSFLGFDFNAALKAKEEALLIYSHMTDYDKKRSVVEARVWEIDCDDPDDKYAVIDAMCERGAYDFF